LAGEHCDLETKQWVESTFRVPALNHWWQTETGSAISATCLGFAQNLHTPNYTTGMPFIGYDSKDFLFTFELLTDYFSFF
jgi:propionyl-CoA synthetase